MEGLLGPNDINVGCDIYVTNSLIDRLNDEQLLGVLAHELSHGDQGHLVVNLMNEGTSIKKHALKYFSDVAGLTCSIIPSILTWR